MDDPRIILFVDNWNALDALVKGTSSLRSWRRLLLALEDPAEEHFKMWVARVPSASNVADAPSRSSLSELRFLEPLCVETPLCPLTGNLLESLFVS